MTGLKEFFQKNICARFKIITGEDGHRLCVRTPSPSDKDTCLIPVNSASAKPHKKLHSHKQSHGDSWHAYIFL